MKKYDKNSAIRTYTDTITFHCPKRGTVKQEVEIYVYASIAAPNPILSSEEIAELLTQYGEMSEE